MFSLEEPAFKNTNESKSQHQFGIAYDPQRGSKGSLSFKELHDTALAIFLLF